MNQNEIKEELVNKLFLLGFKLTEGHGQDTRGVIQYWTTCWYSEKLYAILYDETITVHYTDKEGIRHRDNLGLEYLDQVFDGLTKMLEAVNHDNR